MNIRIRYVGPTNSRGSGFSITTEDGKRKFYPYNYAARDAMGHALDTYCVENNLKYTQVVNFRGVLYVCVNPAEIIK